MPVRPESSKGSLKLGHNRSTTSSKNLRGDTIGTPSSRAIKSGLNKQPSHASAVANNKSLQKYASKKTIASNSSSMTGLRKHTLHKESSQERFAKGSDRL